MKYCQIDEITLLEPGVKLEGLRRLRADEDYLQDHFPRFPVMPGVMMLEALHQASIWLIRTGDDFRSPMVWLREARSVKFGDFLAPGETLKVTANLVKRQESRWTIKATGQKGDRVTVSARLILEQSDSGDPDRLGTDQLIRQRMKSQFNRLFGDPLTLSQ